MDKKCSPFKIRGVIEGFYGVYYTFPERDDLLQFLGANGYNMYVYGPKNDRQHRTRWQEPYPSEIMKKFAENVTTAKRYGLRFVYSLGCGVSICYSSRKDFEAITDKFKAFYDIGVRDFSILLDDISTEFKYEEDRKEFSSYGEAHAILCNRVLTWLKELDSSCTLSMCPTDYHGVSPFSSYMHELGEKLDLCVDIYYTGPEICSPTISHADVAPLVEVLCRQPVIWDNYPVNDLAMQSELHIGPILGRDSNLASCCRGFVVNTMIQAEASKIPLLTFRDYFFDPNNYDPNRSWSNAIREVAGDKSYPFVEVLGENALFSCVSPEYAPKLSGLVERALYSLRAGETTNGNRALDELSDYLTQLDESCYHIKNRMENLALRNNLLPWVEVLEHWHWMAKRALMVLAAERTGEPYTKPLKLMKESLDNINAHPKKIAGDALRKLAEYTLSQVSGGGQG